MSKLISLFIMLAMSALALDVTNPVPIYIDETAPVFSNSVELTGEAKKAVLLERQNINLQISGIGTSLGQSKGEYILLTAFAGSPAEKAGLKSGDVLVAVDGQPVKGQPINSVTGRITGKAGTVVTLTISRAGKSQEVRVTREEMRIHQQYRIAPAKPVADTDSLRPVGGIEFQRTPVSAVIGYLAQISARPIIVNPNVNGVISYRSTRTLTAREAIGELTEVLRTNGLALVNIESRYYRLSYASQTNTLPENPHIELRIEKNQLTVDDDPLALDDLPTALQKRATPQSEIWIYDARNSTNANFSSLQMALSRAGAKPHKVFQAFVPP